MSPFEIWRRSASSFASSSTGSGRWKRSSGTRSTAGAGEERAVADELQRAEERALGLARAAAAPPSSPRPERCTGPGRAAVPARPRPPRPRRRRGAGELVEHDRRVRRDVDAEAGRELREPGALVRAGRDHRAPLALQAALEVHRRAVALEVARRRQHEIGPADREALEHRDREHLLRVLGERADARVGCRLVAGDDQQPDRVGLRRLRRRRPRPRPRRRRGCSASREGGSSRSRACPPSRARARARRGGRRRRRRRPTRRAPRAPPRAAGCRARRRGPPAACAAAAAPPGCVSTDPDGEYVTTSAPFRFAALSQRSTIGARSATGSSPSTTTTSALRDRGERHAEGVERGRGRLGQDGRVRVEPFAQQPRERVGLLDRLRARRTPSRRGPRRRGAATRPRRARAPTTPARGRAGSHGRAGRRSGRPRRGAGRRSGPCRRASPRVDLGVVAGQDPLDLALAHRRGDVAADRAEAADRGHVLDLPRPRLEAVLRRRERADRAELDDVARRSGRGTARSSNVAIIEPAPRSIATSSPSSATSDEKRVQR